LNTRLMMEMKVPSLQNAHLSPECASNFFPFRSSVFLPNRILFSSLPQKVVSPKGMFISQKGYWFWPLSSTLFKDFSKLTTRRATSLAGIVIHNSFAERTFVGWVARIRLDLQLCTWSFTRVTKFFKYLSSYW